MRNRGTAEELVRCLFYSRPDRMLTIHTLLGEGGAVQSKDITQLCRVRIPLRAPVVRTLLGSLSRYVHTIYRKDIQFLC